MRIKDEQVKKQINAYKRNLDNDSVKTGLYTFILFFTVIVYGFFGLLPLGKVLHQKFQTIENLKKLNTDLLSKKENTTKLELEILESKKYIAPLEAAVEEDTYVERFMVSFVDTIAKVGFKQTSMNVTQKEENSVTIRTRAQGAPSQFLPLVRSIENMKRLVVINSFSFNINEADSRADIQMLIYYLKK